MRQETCLSNVFLNICLCVVSNSDSVKHSILLQVLVKATIKRTTTNERELEKKVTFGVELLVQHTEGLRHGSSGGEGSPVYICLLVRRSERSQSPTWLVWNKTDTRVMLHEKEKTNRNLNNQQTQILGPPSDYRSSEPWCVYDGTRSLISCAIFGSKALLER